MEEVEGKEVTSVYEACTMHYDVGRDARRPKRVLPWANPYLSGLLEKERHGRARDGMRVVGVWETKGVVLVYDQSSRIVGGRRCQVFSLLFLPPFLFLLSDVFTDDVRVGQVEVRGLEDEVGTPDGEEPADPSKDQPWVDVRVFPVRVWWAGVGKGSLEGPEVTVRRRDQVGFVGSHDDCGRDGGTENDEDSEY